MSLGEVRIPLQPAASRCHHRGSCGRCRDLDEPGEQWARGQHEAAVVWVGEEQGPAPWATSSAAASGAETPCVPLRDDESG